MKVFISWSGERSRVVGEYLTVWLKCVIQAIRPWMSTSSIERGSIWFSEINAQLKDTAVGIICLTKENKDRPWILFEAGALAKGLTTSRVCPFLIDVETKEVESPLAQFNLTKPDKTGMYELVRTLNMSLENNALDERILIQVFDTYWGQFESKFSAILSNTPENKPNTPDRTNDSMLAEILENTRILQKKICRLENSHPEITILDRSLTPMLSVRGEETVRIICSKLPEYRNQRWDDERIIQHLSNLYRKEHIVEALKRIPF